ncbi:hypothetical protein GUJ93_ZPchr0007g5556 [Zizania palustris]|uniref:Phospholipid/glycerol acyltransferase domain-containing protein n=1 Tax=Zizania palustris TaxID=103762 RepID=A0A8J5TBG5_ZIZPA|nr:hypothetical protein GUJ93_ZPchr0007g5556 [Zizania palustris]
MVFPTILPKIAAHWLFTFYRAARKLRGHAFQYGRNSATKPPSVSHAASAGTASKCTGTAVPDTADKAVVFGFEGAIMRSTALFPYFMLVACEGGSLLRAVFLLCAFPLVWALGERADAGVKVMAFLAFFGLRPNDMDLVARAVLPKFYMEGLNAQVNSRLWLPARRKVVVTSAPRVMVEWFLKEYMAADVVVGRELQMVRVGRGLYFTGLLCGPGSAPVPKQKAAVTEAFGADGAVADVAVVGRGNQLDHPFIPYCKEVYVVNRESSKNARLPRDKYPKPLIFHDGRLAFLPTPAAALAFFLFLPLGVVLSVVRISIGIVLPYKINFAAGALFGVRFRTSGLRAAEPGVKRRGVLYVCTHRTLVDPIMLTTALQKPVPAVTYSLSRLSEIIAPIRTVRLTRDRARDAETMSRLLEHGDLVVCPEGTTCREPYLLRFSPLFAELADDMEPVALDAQVTTLYGTTASGHKWLDPWCSSPTRRRRTGWSSSAPCRMSGRAPAAGPAPRWRTGCRGGSATHSGSSVQGKQGPTLHFAVRSRSGSSCIVWTGIVDMAGVGARSCLGFLLLLLAFCGGAEAADASAHGASKHRLLTTVSVAKPSYPTVSTPMSASTAPRTMPTSSSSMTFPSLATANGGGGVGVGGTWCVASQSASLTALQVALDYACGYGADCSPIQQGGSCFNPDTVHDHASYAFNSYYQKNPIPTSCDFGGTATITNTDPSSGSCQYPASSGGGQGQNTMPPPAPTTLPPPAPTTLTPTTPTPTTPDIGTPVYGSTTPPDYGSMSPPGYGSNSPPDYSDVGAAPATANVKAAALALACVLIATMSLSMST